MSTSKPIVVNVEDAETEEQLHGEHFGGTFKDLTPSMRDRPGALGMNLARIPPGRTMCPFHAHVLADELFYVLSGTGVLRYGDTIHRVRPGDCISCPAGTGNAHQIANNGDEDLVYLAIGSNDPNEVATYPDSNKVLVRSLGLVGQLDKRDYHAGEPDVPRVFALAGDSENP